MSRLYHKKPMNRKFTADEKRGLIEAQKWMLLRPYLLNPAYNTLIGSGLLVEPLSKIDEIIFQDMECPNCELKNIVYQHLSGHDSNIAPLWQYFDLTDFEQDNLNGDYIQWYGIPYASTI